jgi:molybdopterin/thiamine biosynthesis adenylyltransferase
MYYSNSELSYRPIIYNPNTDERQIKELIKQGAQVNDQIESQIKELIKINNPKEDFASDELEAKLQQITTRPFYYGVWVYYPWNNQLLHLLPEDEFIIVRTSRNKYKITPIEQNRLSTKKIGIIGLSVGHSVALTIALERACGELRLCDFDILELSNYNRIRTKLSHLGMKKTTSVAREIAEIDPFLKVHCFHDGLTKENIDNFFTDGGLLDLCIDECDSLDMKINCRLKARELHVPVIMEASDNCTLDVERFDLEPNRPLLHGNLNGLDISAISGLKTAEEKLPFMLAFMPPKSLSARMAASAMELGQSIDTWPQLASSVNYGGGICASIARDVLLGIHTTSGRWQLDVSQYFSNKKPLITKKKIQKNKPISSLDFDNILSKFPVKSGLSELKAMLDKILSDASLAPSGGNMQPWHYHFDENKGLFLFLDKSHISYSIDYQFVSSMISLGAATENIILSAERHKVPLEYTFYDDSKNNYPVAHFYPANKISHPNPHLYNYIFTRKTDRMRGNQAHLDDFILNDLSNNDKPFKELTINWIPKKCFDQFADIYASIERIRLLDEQCHKELMDELRWTKDEELLKKDGISIDSLDLNETERMSLNLLKRSDAVNLLSNWDLGHGFTSLFKKSINTASGLGVICGKSDSYNNFFRVGILLQRIWLNATGHELAFQPVSPVTLLNFTQKKGANNYLNRSTNNEIKKQYSLLTSLLNLTEDFKPFFVFRLAETDKIAHASVRKEISLSYSK